MARLIHPNVVAVHDLGTVGDQLFVAMELVAGSSLDVWLAATVAAVARRAGDVPRGRQGHRRRPPRRPGPPRRQTPQRPDRRARSSAHRRLRAGGAGRGDDPRRCLARRHAGVHVAGATPAATGRRRQRSVQLLRDGLRGALRRAAVRRRERRPRSPPRSIAAASSRRRRVRRCRERSGARCCAACRHRSGGAVPHHGRAPGRARAPRRWASGCGRRAGGGGGGAGAAAMLLTGARIQARSRGRRRRRRATAVWSATAHRDRGRRAGQGRRPSRRRHQRAGGRRNSIATSPAGSTPASTWRAPRAPANKRRRPWSGAWPVSTAGSTRCARWWPRSPPAVATSRSGPSTASPHLDSRRGCVSSATSPRCGRRPRNRPPCPSRRAGSASSPTATRCCGVGKQQGGGGRWPRPWSPTPARPVIHRCSPRRPCSPSS